MAILIRGCRTHNLRNISTEIPSGQIVLFTGVSGSGKSSLALDTIYVEGQRRYLEGLSTGAAFPKAATVDLVEGLSPTLAVTQGQKRSTTVSKRTGCRELFDVLFGHLGVQHSPTTGEPLERLNRTEIVEAILGRYQGRRIRLLAHLKDDIQQRGFVRIFIDGEEVDLSESDTTYDEADVVVDRLGIKPGVKERLYDSVRLALEVGRGILQVECDGALETLAEVYVCPSTGEVLPTKLIDHCSLEGNTIADLEQLPVPHLIKTIRKWNLPGPLPKEVIPRLLERLKCLTQLGLSYLTLHRSGDTLSIGESERVQIAGQIGARLSGITYIFDEPSRGLHARDIHGLVSACHTLKERGNSLLIVDHSPELIAAADHVVELGPGAGKHGGQILFQGSYQELLKSETPTGRWLSGRQSIPPHKVRQPTSFFQLRNASRHNIQNLNLDVPLGCLVAFSGPSGSGKSTLVFDLLKTDSIAIDQSKAGASPRSTPATYIGMMTPLRQLISQTPLARARGYAPAFFTLSKKGGRCEACQGQGQIRIRTDFLPEMWQPCDLCQGKRYSEPALQCLWNGHSLADILAMSVEEALPLFSPIPEISRRLALMQELGLEYLELGQRAPTLSGGEMQRLKLVAQLAKRTQEPTLYILDEPSVGLHLQDIEKLARILHRLVEAGHTVWMIEHSKALLDQADWHIELGPGAGPDGGNIVTNRSARQLG